MPASDRERDLHTLRNLIDEAHAVISTIDLPQGRGKRAIKLLDSALALTDDLIALPSQEETSTLVVFLPPGNGQKEMSTKIKCPECGKGVLSEEIADMVGSRKGESFTIRMDALVCPKCGFKTIPKDRAAQFSLRTANAYRRTHGLLTSMDIRDLRCRLKMTQQQFADFLGVGVASIKRWELGEIQDVAMDHLMRLAAADRDRKRSPEYGPWGGFDQLGEKMAVEKYDPSRRGKRPLELAHGPPFGERHSSID